MSSPSMALAPTLPFAAPSNTLSSEDLSSSSQAGPPPTIPLIQSMPPAPTNTAGTNTDNSNLQRIDYLVNTPGLMFSYQMPDGATLSNAMIPGYLTIAKNNVLVVRDQQHDAFAAFLLDKDIALSAMGDGSVQIKQNGTTVYSDPLGNVSIFSQGNKVAQFPAKTFNPQRDLVQAGYLTADAAAMFINVFANGGLGMLPDLQSTFTSEDTNYLNRQQWDNANQGNAASPLS